MTIIDYVIEDLERVACLASVPEQQRRIIGDQIGRLRAYQLGGIENASIKDELAAIQARYDRLRYASRRLLNRHAPKGSASIEWIDFGAALAESEGE